MVGKGGGRLRTRNLILRHVERRINGILIKRRHLISSLLVTLVDNNRVLLRNIPNLTGAATVRALTGTLKLGFRHISFAPSLLPTSIVNALVCGRGSNSFRPHGNPIFAGLLLTSRVGHTPTGIRDTLLRTVRRHHIALNSAACSLPGPFLIVTARGPVRRGNACTLPRTRISHFVLGSIVSCPAHRSREHVVGHFAHERRVRIGTIMSPRRIASLVSTLSCICYSRGINRCVLSLVRTAHSPGGTGLGRLSNHVRVKTSPHTAL